MLPNEVLLTQQGPLARVWLAAHWERKLNKAQFLQTDIPASVETIVGEGEDRRVPGVAVGLLVAEIGGVSLRIDDASRPLIAAAQELRAMESVVRDDVLELLTQAVPGFDAVAPQFLQALAGPRTTRSPARLEQLVQAVPDPGAKRLFVDLVRRRGEVDGDTDTELWAIHKYEGG